MEIIIAHNHSDLHGELYMSGHQQKFRQRVQTNTLNETIDFVIPWVDGSDSAWSEKMKQWLPAGFSPKECCHRDWGLLRYWFRAVEKFAPWVNRIHFVTDGQRPDWLDISHPKLNPVDHKDFIPSEWLPCFSSHPIELNMHRIGGLSEHFVYFNDDTFLLRPVSPELFFKDGIPGLVAALESRTPYNNGIHCYINNTITLSSNFDIPKRVMANKGVWLNPLRNGIGTVIRNCLYLKYFEFTNLAHNNHLPTPYRKSLLEEVWNSEPGLLSNVSSHRFRQDDDVNQWLFHNWALMKGEFFPVREKQLGRFHMISGIDGAIKASEDIKHQKCRMICVNDDILNRDEFESIRSSMEDAFKKLLPEKSSFERY